VVNLAERVQAVRKRSDRERHNKELAAWKDKQTGADGNADTIKAEWLRLRETNPRAGGAGVDRLLGVETPVEPLVALPADQEPTPKPIAVQKPLTAAEWAKAESERVQAETAEFQSRDFLTQLTGVGYTQSSGPAKRRWDA
jgi:hypothetical protein